jgi:hypothetical protein
MSRRYKILDADKMQRNRSELKITKAGTENLGMALSLT